MSTVQEKRTMKAVAWFGKNDVRLIEKEIPEVQDDRDAVIRITSTTICGSDLHLYNNELPGLKKGDIIGHECMGRVEQVGKGIDKLKVGDRVVVSFDIAEGSCFFCKHGYYSACDLSNPKALTEPIYGKRLGAAFGYTHLMGGFDGCQAEYVRVPYADVNCLKLPEHGPDEKYLLLSDVLPTSWHANEQGGVREGDVVAVWGLGPVGLLSCAWAKFRRASRVIGIDQDPFRLNLASNKLGIEVLDFSKVNVVDKLREMVPKGLDVGIEASGFRFAQSMAHKVQRAVGLETDTPEILEQIFKAVRKCGRVSIIGDYATYANAFPIGTFMEKGLSMAGGQCPVQKYWDKILYILEQDLIDPTFIMTHIWPLERIVEAYKIFNNHEDNAVKMIMKTPAGMSEKVNEAIPVVQAHGIKALGFPTSGKVPEMSVHPPVVVSEKNAQFTLDRARNEGAGTESHIPLPRT